MVVKVVKVKMVKIDFGYAVKAHYNIKFYIIVADFDNQISILTKMTLTK